MSLCGDCRELKFELTTPAKRTWRSKLLYWKATEASGFVRPDRTRLASFEVLEQNSAGGCVFCNIIMWIVRSDPDVHSLIKRTLRDSNDYVKLNIENLAGLDSVDGEHSSEKTYRTGNLLVSTRTTERNLKYAVNRQDQFKSGLATWQTSTNVTFDHSLPVVRQWINGCDSSHPGCPQDSQPLPKRLVHVAFSSGQIVLKLVQQDGLQEAKMGRYAALSHCWGNPEGVLRTLSDNIHIHLESIPFDDLSKTFKDAVRITKELGLCYLWIDSLCIVQDDLHDWQEESAKMPEIYQNAYVTIAATASPGSHRGCLFPRDPAKSFALYKMGGTLSLIPSNTARKKQVPMKIFIRPLASRTNSLDKSPLHQRGWVVQETVLSQRIIHFAEDQLFWSCRSGTKSEDGTYNEPSAAIPADLSFPLAAHISWWTWVENYSARGLTMQSDKLPAMAGLTKLVERERGWQAAVGLWMNDLHYGLLWRTEGAARRICPDTDNVYIPSWSWASIKGPVKRSTLRDLEEPTGDTRRTTDEAEITLGEIRWTGEELTSPLDQSAAKLLLKARLRRAFFKRGTNHEFNQARSYSGMTEHAYLLYHKDPRAFGPDSTITGRDSQLWFDDAYGPLSEEAWCVQISVTEYSESTSYHNIVILEPADQSSVGNVFRRIGVGMLLVEKGEPDFFYRKEKKNVIVV